MSSKQRRERHIHPPAPPATNYSRLTPHRVRRMRRLHERRGLCISCIALLHRVPYATAWEAIRYQTSRQVR